MSPVNRRFALALVVMLLVIPPSLTACSRGNSASTDGSALAWKVEPSPPARGPATITIEPRYDDRTPITGAKLEIEGNMNHAGMAPVIATLTETTPGTYVSDGFEFTMGGDWVISVRGTLPDGTPYQAQIDVGGVGG